jgi:hypothetical protein
VVETEIGRIQRILDQHEKRLGLLEKQLRSKPRQVERTVSIREFILEKRPGTDIEKALVVGFFLERYQNTSSFNTDDLENCFLEAKEPAPNNINLAIIGNIKKGQMMEVKEKKNGKKSWMLTNTGTSRVEQGFGEEGN